MYANPTSSLPPHYTLTFGTPAVPSYLRCCRASGLSPKTPPQAAAVTSGTWYGCYITHTDPSGHSSLNQTPSQWAASLAAAGGASTSSIWRSYPGTRRKGLGDVILKNLSAHIMKNKAEGVPYVNFLADEPGRKLYRRDGVVDAIPHSLRMAWEGGEPVGE